MIDQPLPFPSAVPTAPAAASAASAPQGPAGAHPCIMLVDDEPVVTEVLRLQLEDAGYTNTVVSNESTSATALVREHQPQLLLLDLRMPEVSGFDVLEALRRDPDTRRLPVIVLTSATDPASKLRALELEVTDFLAKPVDPSELLIRVRNTLAVKAYEDQLTYADHVTGLANRRRFLADLDRALAEARPAARRCAVLQVGMDRFKRINDALGYDAGDRVLRQLGKRIYATLATADGALTQRGLTVARTGGDEFSVLLANAGSPQDVTRVAAAVRACVAEPMNHFGEPLYLCASVGVSTSPDNGDDVDTLLARAAQAMSFAKRRGGDTLEVYSGEIDSWARKRLALERDLRNAYARDELRLAFQPKVDVATGRVTGAEALLRWRHPVHGDIPPVDFIPIAEETGLIVPVGGWVLRESCRQAAAWQRAGLGALRVAVNVSIRQFQDSGLLCRQVQEALDYSRLAPQHLTLEVTESMLVHDLDEAARVVEGLKAQGVRMSVDDFGTGYSSLVHLRRFSVDELKIDRSFVRDTPHNEDDAAIVTAVVAMAHGLGMHVVAEGVETRGQLEFLRGLGCDQYQGYLFSRPVAPEAFAAAIAKPLAQTG